ncbi:FtsK/SpoIIIE domain-containing protein [Rhabdothermincola sediminis]|uniref:FtsK/SpoIIIE domain-containing protein n=1 Tax=Rhabdothermincola sediminis TaxID=2751370 RepID=UPI001AA030EA|nr:FtsK/SpoIIIE domain-containing protein [Rhabdothermincola sediminis]
MTHTLTNLPEPDTADAKLPPLPKRVGDESSALDADPLAVVDELLERTSHLLDTLHADVAGLERDQAEEQQRIEARWRAQQAAVEQGTQRLAELYRDARDLAARKGKADVLETALSRPATLGTEDRDRPDGFDRLIARLEEELRLARGITGTIRLPEIGVLLNAAAARLELMEQEAERTRQRLISETEDELVAEGTEARASFEIGTMILQRDLDRLAQALPVPGAPWDDPRWASLAPAEAPQPWIRLGALVHEELPDATIPWLGSLRDGLGLLVETGTRRADAVAGVQGILTRVLAAVPPGGVRLALADPKGLGDTFAPFLALAEFDPALVCGGVRVTPEEIEECLEELTRHVEHVIATHLQGRYPSITDAHLDLGEVIEPYRLLVIADYPTGLTERALELLGPLAENGPRCGVHTIVLRDPAVRARTRHAALPGLRTCRHDADGFTVDTHRTGAWRFRFEPCPPPGGDGPAAGVGERVVTLVGEHARRRAHTPLGHAEVFAMVDHARQRAARDDLPQVRQAVDPADPSSWWSADARVGVSIPLGQMAGRRPATLWLDSAGAPGALVVGGAGKELDHALDTILTALTVLYEPAEVELVLADLSHSIDLEAYGEARLPHARLVATEADPDLGLAAFELVEAELDLRDTLLRAAGLERGDVEAFRAATGGPLSRLLLVVAGASRLFAGSARIARDARRILNRLVVEGPALGLHVVALERVVDSLEPIAWVPDALGTSLVLADAAALATPSAGEDLAAAIRSIGTGEALLLRPGSTEPTRLRMSRVSPRERLLQLRDLDELAAERGLARRPEVVSSTAPAVLEASALDQLRSAGAERAASPGSTGSTGRASDAELSVWVGAPVTLGGPVEVTLRREPGSNLLVVTADEQAGHGILAAALLSAAAVHGHQLEVRAIDCLPLESGFGELLAALGGLARVQASRSRELDAAIERAAREVVRRKQARSTGEPPVLVVLNGVDLARDLDPGGGEVTALLEALVSAGPPWGVHTIIRASSAAAVADRLAPGVQRRFTLRAVGPMPAEDAVSLVDSPAAVTLAPTQALLYDEGAGRVVRLRPFQVPSPAWIRALAAGAAPAGQRSTSRTAL